LLSRAANGQRCIASVRICEAIDANRGVESSACGARDQERRVTGRCCAVIGTRCNAIGTRCTAIGAHRVASGENCSVVGGRCSATWRRRDEM